MKLQKRGISGFVLSRLLTCRATETAQMTARLGRASYVGREALPPDPGAVGFAALVEGIANALGEK